jgi:hypothetical protein
MSQRAIAIGLGVSRSTIRDTIANVARKVVDAQEREQRTT